MGGLKVTAADASPEDDLCIPCWEHRHEDCTDEAWCSGAREPVTCFCGNEWHRVDWYDPQDVAWWSKSYPAGINCHRSDSPHEHWNRAAMRGLGGIKD